MNLGVNIDHIALLREGRKMDHPDPIEALVFLQLANADQVTVHLREDRRHIKDNDVINIINQSKIPVNLECALNEEIVNFACKYRPDRVTFVPEKREEVTTEGGLDIENNFDKIFKYTRQLKMNDVEVSLFIDPNIKHIKGVKSAEIDMVEFHTGAYANIFAMLSSNLSKTHNSISDLNFPKAKLKKLLQVEIDKIKESCKEAKEFKIETFAGHGLNYQNVQHILQIKDITELNIGQSIIARAVFVGLETAIRQMKEIIEKNSY